MSEDFSPVRHWFAPFPGNVPGSEVEHFFQGRFRLEHLARFRGLAYLAVESFDGVGGIDDPAQILGVLEIGREVAPVISPASYADGIGLSPFRFELGQVFLRDLESGGLVDALQIRHELVRILAAYVLHGVAYLMDDAPLYCHVRKDVPDGGGESGKPVYASDANIFHSPAAEVVAHLLPERGGFGIADVESEHFLHALLIDSEHEVHALGFHLGILPYLEVYRVEIDDGVEGVQRPPLPFDDVRKDFVRDVADEVPADVGPVDVAQVGLYVPGGKPERVHVYYLVFYLEGPGLELGHDLRLEFPIAVSRDFNFCDSLPGEDVLGVCPVAGVAGVVPARGMLWVSEMGIHLRLEHLFDEGTGKVFQESPQFVVGTHF